MRRFKSYATEGKTILNHRDKRHQFYPTQSIKMPTPASTKIHPLVRDLYNRALFVGKDYPLGMDYVRKQWKAALRRKENCPACYNSDGIPDLSSPQCQKELHKAVGKGRYFVREMIALIQFKKYRSMKQRYDSDNGNAEVRRLLEKLQAEKIEEKAADQNNVDVAGNDSAAK